MIVTNLKQILFLMFFINSCAHLEKSNTEKTCFFVDKDYIIIKFDSKDKFSPLVLNKSGDDIIIERDYFKLSGDTLYLKPIDGNNLNITDFQKRPKVDIKKIETKDRTQGFKFDKDVRVVVYQNRTIEKCINNFFQNK